MTESENNKLPLVSIITINYNNPLVTCRLLRSIKENGYKNCEVVVVNNASIKRSPQLIQKEIPNSKLIFSSTNLGSAGGNNLSLKYALGPYMFFLNNNTVIGAKTIGTLVQKLIDNKELEAISSKNKFYSDPRVIQYAGSKPVNPLTIINKYIGNHQVDNGQHDVEEDTNYAHGAAMMVPKSVINTIGPMPDKYFLCYKELDWCESIQRREFKIRYIPSAIVMHKESMFIGKDSIIKFYYKLFLYLHNMRDNLL